MTGPAPAVTRRVIGKAECCGRDVLERETAQEWAEAELAHHGAPPADVLDLVRALATQSAH